MPDTVPASGQLTGSRRRGVREWVRSQLDGLRDLRGERTDRALLIGLAVIAVTTGLHLLNAVLIEGSFLNYSDPANLPSAVSSGFFLVAAVLAWRAAREGQAGAERRAWIGVTVIAAAFAVEALADIHHKIEGVEGLQTIVLISYPVLAILFLVLVAPPLLRMRSPLPLLFLLAAALIIASQALSAYENTAGLPGVAADLETIAEECLEMLSPLTLIVAALFALDGGDTERGGEAVANR